MQHLSKKLKEFKGKQGKAVKSIVVELVLQKGEEEVVECDAYSVQGNFVILTKIVDGLDGMYVVNIPVPLERVKEFRAPYNASKKAE